MIEKTERRLLEAEELLRNILRDARSHTEEFNSPFFKACISGISEFLLDREVVSCPKVGEKVVFYKGDANGYDVNCGFATLSSFVCECEGSEIWNVYVGDESDLSLLMIRVSDETIKYKELWNGLKQTKDCQK